MNRDSLRDIMLFLLYPAIYGAGLVWTLSALAGVDRWWEPFVSLRTYLALWLLIFFAACFNVSNNVPDGRYTVWSFILDLLEIAAVFLCFVFLGYVTAKQNDLSAMFWILATVPPLQGLWNHSVKGDPLWGLAVLTSATCVVAASLADQIPYAVWYLLGLLYALLYIYINIRIPKGSDGASPLV